MTIDDMPAGPEMDRLVAEKVMGWHARGFDGKRHDWYDGHDFIRGWSYWNPSTNIAHAWEVVVERMRDHSRFFNVCQRLEVCWCEVVDYEGMPLDRTKAETAPLAICRAALKALEPEA